MDPQLERLARDAERDRSDANLRILADKLAECRDKDRVALIRRWLDGLAGLSDAVNNLSHAIAGHPQRSRDARRLGIQRTIHDRQQDDAGYVENVRRDLARRLVVPITEGLELDHWYAVRLRRSEEPDAAGYVLGCRPDLRLALLADVVPLDGGRPLPDVQEGST